MEIVHRCLANAKINIGLHIIGRREDGYHLMETLYYPVPELYDRIEFSEIGGSACQVTMQGLSEHVQLENNLCWRAWDLMRQHFGVAGLHISVTKGIPAGAGLGGGSSDAAAVLLGLRAVFELKTSDAELADLGAKLGADVPFFIYNRPLYATGIGTEFEAYQPDLGGFDVRVRTSQVFSSTPAAFRALAVPIGLPDIPRHAQPLKELLRRPVREWKGLVRNDLEPAVFQMHPAVEQLRDGLYHDGAVYAAMSGSGSACFGIFDK